MKNVVITKKSKNPKSKTKDLFKCKECGNTDLHWMKIANSIIGVCLNPDCANKTTNNANVSLATVQDNDGNEFYIPLCQHCKETVSEITVDENDLVPKVPCPPGGSTLYRKWFLSQVKK